MPLPLVGKKTPADPFAHCLEDYRRRYYPPGWESDPQKGGDLPVPLPSTPAPKGDAAAPRASPSPPPDPEAKYAPGQVSFTSLYMQWLCLSLETGLCT